MVPATPFITSPVEGFISAPSPGAGLKLKVPPVVAIPEAAFAEPEQKSVTVNDASSVTHEQEGLAIFVSILTLQIE